MTKLLTQPPKSKLCIAYTAAMIAGDESHIPFLKWYHKEWDGNPSWESILSGEAVGFEYTTHSIEDYLLTKGIALQYRAKHWFHPAKYEYLIITRNKDWKNHHAIYWDGESCYDCNFFIPNVKQPEDYLIRQVYKIKRP